MKLTAFIPILLFIFLSSSLFGQKKFAPGSIEFQDGEKLQGLIDIKNLNRNPKQIIFKHDSKAPEQLLNAATLKSFQMQNGDLYISQIVSIDMLPVNYGQLQQQGTTMNVIDTVFLRRLVSGPALSLYELKNGKTHFYYQGTGGKIEELEYKVFVKNVQQKNNRVWNDEVQEQFNFRNQLRVYVLNDASMLYKIDNADYNAKTLIKIVTSINEIAGHADKRTAAGIKKIFFGAGGSSNEFKFSGANNFQFLDKLEGQNKGGSILKLNGDFYGTEKLRNAFLRTEISYSQFKYSGRIQTTTGASYHLRLNDLATSAILAYNFLGSSEFNLYVGAGPGINFSSYPRNTISTTSPYLPEEQMKVKKVWYEISSRVGFFYKVMNLEVSYRIAGSPFNFPEVHSRFNTLAITFALGFKL